MELDWTKPEQYKALTNKISIDQWRWEFLRRTPDYRRAWVKRSGNDKKDALHASCFDLEKLFDPDACAKDIGDGLKFGQRFGYQLHDIKCALLGTIKLSKKEKIELDTEFFTDSMRSKLIDKQKAVFIFDITRPIDEQIGHVKSQLLSLQEAYDKNISQQLSNNGKRRPKRGVETEVPLVIKNRIQPKFNHLRVLDAHKCGANYKTIGEVIFGVRDPNEASKRGKRELIYASQMHEIL